MHDVISYKAYTALLGSNHFQLEVPQAPQEYELNLRNLKGKVFVVTGHKSLNNYYNNRLRWKHSVMML